MDRKTGWMYAACGLIISACAAMFAFGMAAAREMILCEPLMAAHAAGIYFYCIGAALPCMAAVAMLGMVVREIGHDRAFSTQNAKWMRGIAAMAAAECVYIIAGLIGWSMVGLMHPGVVLVALSLVMFGAGVGILAWALSRLILRACAIQEENDLTI